MTSPGSEGRSVPWALPLVAAALGVFLGWAAAKPLSGLAVGNLVVWGTAVVALGLLPGSRGTKAIRLWTFGFVVGFTFMCFGYEGSAALVTRVVPFALIGVFSGLCAIALGALVHGIMTLAHTRG